MIAPFFALVIALTGFAAAAQDRPTTAYDFTFQSIEGDPLPMAAYRGKVMLVVNTASFCGFTKQYNGLQEVWARYRTRGFILLGVPSNDFGSQEPGKESEIKTFCEVNFGIDFPMTSKVTVAGPEAHPFYQWVVREKGASAKPRWNFHKYLIGPDGQVANSFVSPVKPTSKAITNAIEAQLARAEGNSQ